jgi:hypothetical protein
MTQQKSKTTPLNPVITMADICERFNLTPRYCRTLFRRGVIQGKPLRFYKRPGRQERRPVDWFVSRAEFRRLEREGLVAPSESEVEA